MSLSPGAQLGAYRLVERLSADGPWVVWRALQVSLERDVALTMLSRELGSRPGFLDRFRGELSPLFQLRHAAILPVLDIGEHDGVPFLATRLLPGTSLAWQLGQPWSIAEAVRILRPLAAALDYAHARNIIHGELSPAWVAMTEQRQVVVGGFEVARLRSLVRGETPDATGQSERSLYSPPEQVPSGQPDPAADRYAFGLIAYQMLTGRFPFTADDSNRPAGSGYRPPPAPRSLNPALPPAIEAILLQAITRNPTDRFGTAAALVDALAAASRDDGDRPASAATRQVPSTALPPIPTSWSPETEVAPPEWSLEQTRPQPEIRTTRQAPVQPPAEPWPAEEWTRAPGRPAPVRRGPSYAGLLALAALGIVLVALGAIGARLLAGQQVEAPAAPTQVVARPPSAAEPTTVPTPQAPPTAAPGATSPPVPTLPPVTVPTATARTAPTEAPPKPTAPAPTQPPAPGTAGVSPSVLAADRGVVESKGFAPQEHAAAPLSGDESLIAIRGVCGGSATGNCQQVFFFIGTRYLGTDTLNTSRAIGEIAAAGPARIRVTYPNYAPNDPNCCPSRPPVTITYTWNGQRLTPDGVPPGHQ